MNHKIPSEILAILRQVTIADNTVKLPPGKLDRKTYDAVNKVLVLAGGKWNTKLKGHLFPEPPGDVLADAVATGEILDAKKAFQFYATPPELARKMAEMLDLKKDVTILEPSAGSGALLKAVWEKFPGLRSMALDMDEKRVKELDRLDSGPNGHMTMKADFLQWATLCAVKFDRVIMNPPFTKGQDIKHVRAAYNLLNPKGKLVAITSPGWTFRQDAAHAGFRAWVESSDHTIEHLEPGTFKESGTMVNAVLLTMDKDK